MTEHLQRNMLSVYNEFLNSFSTDTSINDVTLKSFSNLQLPYINLIYYRNLQNKYCIINNLAGKIFLMYIPMLSVPTPPASSSAVQSAPTVTLPVINLKNSFKSYVKYHKILRDIATKLIKEILNLLDLRL